MYQQVLDPVAHSLAWSSLVVIWSVVFLALRCVLSALQASPVLSWMVPS